MERKERDKRSTKYQDKKTVGTSFPTLQKFKGL